MHKAKLRATIVLTGAMLVGWLAIPPRAQSPPATPVSLAKSIVGHWRGDAIFSNPRTNFGRTILEMRFTDYGIVTVSRGPMDGAGLPSSSAWTGDYLVLGTSVLISPHIAGQSGFLVRVLAVTAENDRLEGLPIGPGVGQYELGAGIQLRRQ